MATLFSPTLSSSSPFLSSTKPLKPLHFPKPKTTPFNFHKPLTVISSLNPTTPPAVNTFWKWLTDQKLVSSNSPAKPGLVPEGLGLVAQRNIGQNEVVLEIPKKFWINPDTVSGSDIGKVCGGLKPWISVALFLIREKFKDGSTWRDYINVLPEYTDSTIFWCVRVAFSM